MKENKSQGAINNTENQQKKIVQAFLWLIVALLNSFVYASILSRLQVRAGLWGFVGYVFLIIFVLKYLALFPRITGNYCAMLCIIITVILTFTAYLIAYFPFLSTGYFMFAGMQITGSMVAIYAFKLSTHEKKLITNELRLNASKEDVAAYMTNSSDEAFRSLFHAMTTIMFACIALLISFGVAMFVRHTEIGNKTCLYLFVFSEVVFLIFDMMKFVICRQVSFIRCGVELIVEVLFMGLLYYLHSTVYRQSNSYDIFMLLPPIIAVIPFVNSSSQIAKKYIQAANEKVGKASNE